VESIRQSRFLAGAVTCGEPMLQQSVPEGLYPVARAHAGAIIEKLCMWEGPHAGAGEECEKEGAAEMECYELTETPILCPSALFGGRRG